MIRRRYRIEVSLLTLARFTTAASVKGASNAFIQRVTPDSNEEYYYVVLIANQDVHDELKQNRFTDSIALKS